MNYKLLTMAVAVGCWGGFSISSAQAADEMTSTQLQQRSAQIQTELNKMQTMQQSYQSEIERMKQLREQYEAKLKQLSSQTTEQQKVVDQSVRTPNNSAYAKLQDKIDRIHIFGFFRAKYDHDDKPGVGADSNNKHFYMDLEAKMRVNKDWYAHFQSEARKGYTVNQSWREGDPGKSDQDGTVQRIWVEGSAYDINIAVGTKWWGLGFQSVPFGHAADGISADYDVVKNWNVKGFWWRPRQGDLVTMPNGQETNIRGINVTGQVTDKLATSLTYANNKNDDNQQKMNNMQAFELKYQLTPDILLRSAYVHTNAKNNNTSQEYRIDYKGYKLQEVHSWGLYTRYIDFGLYGDYSHDDEWNSLPSDAKGVIFGATFVPFKNIVWESFFSVQRRNRASALNHDAMRHQFRTQIDYHF